MADAAVVRQGLFAAPHRAALLGLVLLVGILITLWTSRPSALGSREVVASVSQAVLPQREGRPCNCSRDCLVSATARQQPLTATRAKKHRNRLRWDCRRRPFPIPKKECQQSPFFLAHVPISGGTTFHRVIVKALTMALGIRPTPCPGNLVTNSISFGNAKSSGFCKGHAFLDDGNRRNLLRNASIWDACHLLTSHDPLSVLLHLPCSNFRSIAILRHPLQHRWSMWSKRWHIKHERFNSNFTLWLTSKPAASEYQLSFYADVSSAYPSTYLHPNDTEAVRQDRDLALRVAKANLNSFAVVGTLERLDDTIEAFARTVGLGKEAVAKLQAEIKGVHVHRNVHKGKPPPEATTDEFLERVMGHEMELYRHATRMLDAKLAG